MFYEIKGVGILSGGALGLCPGGFCPGFNHTHYVDLLRIYWALNGVHVLPRSIVSLINIRFDSLDLVLVVTQFFLNLFNPCPNDINIISAIKLGVIFLGCYAQMG